MIRTTKEQRTAVRNRLSPSIEWKSEKIWTYLVAEILERAPVQGSYLSALCGRSIADAERMDSWFEAQPLAPRKGTSGVDNESNTKIDLAVGAIRRRGRTGSGIEFDSAVERSWVCFVEGKGVERDCDFMTVYDPLRNQLERNIESLLCFQSAGQFPTEVCFTLLTPRRFKEHPRSRLYGYRMTEYLSHANLILTDIERCSIAKRDSAAHRYPPLAERLSCLSLRWVTYEEILEPYFGVTGIDILEPLQIPGLRECFEQLAIALEHFDRSPSNDLSETSSAIQPQVDLA